MHQYIIIILSMLHFFFPLTATLVSLGDDVPSGFTMEFHILYMIAHLSRHLYYLTIPKELLVKIPEELQTTYSIQRLVESAEYAHALIALFVSSFYTQAYYEKKLNAKWIVGGIIASYVLAAGFTNSSEVSSRSIWYTFGLYLEVISFLPQFGLTLQKMYMEPHVLLYYVDMFIYDVLSVTGLTYRAFASNFYTTVGLNLHVLKFLLCYGVFSSYVFKKFNRSRLWFQRQDQGEEQDQDEDNDYPIAG